MAAGATFTCYVNSCFRSCFNPAAGLLSLSLDSVNLCKQRKLLLWTHYLKIGPLHHLCQLIHMKTEQLSHLPLILLI